MSGQPSASADTRLLEACTSGRLVEVQSVVDDYKDGSIPPYSEMMLAATKHDQSSIVAYCLSRGGKLTHQLIQRTVMEEAWQTFQVLVTEGGLDINYELEYFMGDFLNVAALHGEVDMVRFCLDHGADPNLHFTLRNSSALAAAAAFSGSAEIVTLLIEKGNAAVNGSNALVMAAGNGRTEMVRLLLDYGADINELGVHIPYNKRAARRMGTPLHKAVKNKHIQTLAYLLERGANAEKPDSIGRTPLQLARELGHDDAAAVLESHLAAVKSVI